MFALGDFNFLIQCCDMKLLIYVVLHIVDHLWRFPSVAVMFLLLRHIVKSALVLLVCDIS